MKPLPMAAADRLLAETALLSCQEPNCLFLYENCTHILVRGSVPTIAYVRYVWCSILRGSYPVGGFTDHARVIGPLNELYIGWPRPHGAEIR